MCIDSDPRYQCREQISVGFTHIEMVLPADKDLHDQIVPFNFCSKLTVNPLLLWGTKQVNFFSMLSIVYIAEPITFSSSPPLPSPLPSSPFSQPKLRLIFHWPLPCKHPLPTTSSLPAMTVRWCFKEGCLSTGR